MTLENPSKHFPFHTQHFLACHTEPTDCRSCIMAKATLPQNAIARLFKLRSFSPFRSLFSLSLLYFKNIFQFKFINSTSKLKKCIFVYLCNKKMFLYIHKMADWMFSIWSWLCRNYFLFKHHGISKNVQLLFFTSFP